MDKLAYSLLMAVHHPSLFMTALKYHNIGAIGQKIYDLEQSNPVIIEMDYKSRHKSENSFHFNNQRYTYFYHSYNNPAVNERTIEVPIAKKEIDLFRPEEVLEIGNVLSNYFPIKHKIVDKYEKKLGIINIDVAEFPTANKFKFIVSISTIEHIGWDERPKDPAKIPKILGRTRLMLQTGGRALFTAALGQNKYLDSILEQGNCLFDDVLFMHRVSFDNRWEQCDIKTALSAGCCWSYRKEKDGAPFKGTNAILVGILRA